MISSARPAAAAANAGTSTAAPQAADSSAAPFDSVLALETIAADAHAAQLDLLSAASAEGGLEGLQEDLLTDDDGDDAEEGDELALGPLALLGMLMNAAAPVHSQATSAAEGVEDALASGGRASGPLPGDGAQLGLALSAPLQDSAGEVATATPDKLLAIMADGAGTADAAADAGRPGDAVNRAAEWMTHGVRHGQPTDHAPMTTHVRDPRWAEEFGTRIALMVRGGESSASLQLTPVDLGPMEVSVTVKDGQASVHFGAAQAETRALIEASIPRLREMLAAQGFNLMDASVSQGFSRQARPDAPRATQLQSEPEAESRTATRIESTRLLDTYA